MIKIVCLFNRKPGMSMEEFKDYYENNHVPLIKRLLPPASDYRRNFREPQEHKPGHMDADRPTGEPQFDVITELTWEDEEAYRKTVELLADPEIGRIVAEDEAKFFDRPSMRSYIVDERRTAPWTAEAS